VKEGVRRSPVDRIEKRDECATPDWASHSGRASARYGVAQFRLFSHEMERDPESCGRPINGSMGSAELAAVELEPPCQSQRFLEGAVVETIDPLVPQSAPQLVVDIVEALGGLERVRPCGSRFRSPCWYKRSVGAQRGGQLHVRGGGSRLPCALTTAKRLFDPACGIPSISDNWSQKRGAATNG